MLKLTALSNALDNVSTGVRGIIGTVLVLSALVGGFATVRAVAQLPGLYAAHAAKTEEQTKIMDKMLCIQVADHRKIDWRMCYINPSIVVPMDDTNAAH